MGSYYDRVFLKLEKNKDFIASFFISPVFAGVVGFATSDLLSGSKWLASLLAMSVTHSLLLLPLIIGVLASFICRYEHLHGGWKQLLSLPVRREHVYLAKFIMIAVLIAVNQLLFRNQLDPSWSSERIYRPDSAGSPVEELGWGGWISTLPLAALLLFRIYGMVELCRTACFKCSVYAS
ncbi:hypothetical protein GCM10020331_023200 [Ectobacillus funiculus]